MTPCVRAPRRVPLRMHGCGEVPTGSRGCDIAAPRDPDPSNSIRAPRRAPREERRCDAALREQCPRPCGASRTRDGRAWPSLRRLEPGGPSRDFAAELRRLGAPGSVARVPRPIRIAWPARLAGSAEPPASAADSWLTPIGTGLVRAPARQGAITCARSALAAARIRRTWPALRRARSSSPGYAAVRLRRTSTRASGQAA